MDAGAPPVCRGSGTCPFCGDQPSAPCHHSQQPSQTTPGLLVGPSPDVRPVQRDYLPCSPGPVVPRPVVSSPDTHFVLPFCPAVEAGARRVGVLHTWATGRQVVLLPAAHEPYANYLMSLNLFSA
ncbi:unnamed protein product [Rangifer tarandus platyrhynchus]|uniref:Uncharacterized protein n=1 Tax=Rangifer tarandus platyrhynchus TaxID=3082113 RepID=A0ABN8XQN7_RANTA|nr:unnamed protein product [Rangifer tarandus platyrhynchus]